MIDTSIVASDFHTIAIRLDIDEIFVGEDVLSCGWWETIVHDAQ